MDAQPLDLKYRFHSGAIVCYRGSGTTRQSIWQPDAPENPGQVMETSVMLKTLYEDRKGRFHLLQSSIPARMTEGDHELKLPSASSVYAMVDCRGSILESTDTALMLIHPLPSEPVPMGYQWECSEHVQPADSAAPLLATTCYTLEKECEVEGVPHLQITFRTLAISYISTHHATRGVSITCRREGSFLFDPHLGQISRIEQASVFSAEQKAGYTETTYRSVLALGEILQDFSSLPKQEQASSEVIHQKEI